MVIYVVSHKDEEDTPRGTRYYYIQNSEVKIKYIKDILVYY